MAAGKENPKRRDYKLGFTINPQGTQISVAKMNDKIIANTQLVARVAELATLIATDLLRAHAPSEILDLLQRQADTDVPVTYGDVKTRFFSKS
jgi:hypothetical protein